MGWANRITFFRIALAPVMAGLFGLLPGFPAWRWWLLGTLWVLFLVSEASDVLDGWVARKFGETSDLGKVLDPFSDVLSRLTLFLCFLLLGEVPAWFFLIVLYREVSVTFVRMLLMQKGIVQAASSGGKTKAVLYFLVSLLALLHLSVPEWGPGALVWWGTQGLLVVTAAVSVFSFWQYFQNYRKAP